MDINFNKLINFLFNCILFLIESNFYSKFLCRRIKEKQCVIIKETHDINSKYDILVSSH